MPGIGIIGAGSMGYQHASYLSENNKVTKLGIYDVVPQKAKELAERFGGIYYADLESLLNDKDIQGVFIITPPSTHLDITAKAMSQGKHVFCEKPVAESMESAKRILEITSQYSKQFFMIGFPERFNGPNIELKKLVQEGRLGEIRMIRTNSRLSLETYQKEDIKWLHSRKSGGGVIVEASIHSWDLMLWIGGSKLKRVHAEGKGIPQDTGDIFDTDVAAVGILENGILVVNDSTFMLPKNSLYDKKIEVFGTEATVTIDYLQQNFRMFTKDKNEIGGGVFDGMFFPDFFWFSHQFGAVKNEEEAFIKAIEEPSYRPESGAQEAVNALEAVLAVAKSVDESKLTKKF